MTREYTAFANMLADLKTAVHFFEKAIQPLARYVLSDDLAIKAGARALQGDVDDVGAKDLNGHGDADFAQQLMHEDRNRVRFFSRSTTGYPHAEGPAASVREGAAEDSFQSFKG